jgi:hypothetical protein
MQPFRDKGPASESLNLEDGSLGCASVLQRPQRGVKRIGGMKQKTLQVHYNNSKQGKDLGRGKIHCFHFTPLACHLRLTRETNPPNASAQSYHLPQNQTALGNLRSQ